MNKNALRGVATALRAMKVPPSDATFDDLLAQLETVAGTRATQSTQNSLTAQRLLPRVERERRRVLCTAS